MTPVSSLDGAQPKQVPNTRDQDYGSELRGIWTTHPQAWLAAIVDSSDDAIIGKTLDSVIRSWNRAASRIFGYEADEIIGRPVTTLMPPDRQFEELQIVARLVRGERVDHFETVRMRKDGTRIDVSLSVSPIRGPQGEIVGAAKVARDVTESKRAEQELLGQLQNLTIQLEQQIRERDSLHESAEKALRLAEEARRVAEEASSAKSRFVATVSHELRTPLNAITGYVELLEMQIRGPVTPEQREDLMRIRKSADVLRRLIDDVLSLARMESGHLEYRYETVSLDRFLGTLESFIAPRVTQKGLRYRFDPDGCDMLVAIDRDKVEQIMLNLLSNAVKYTEKGSITLRCRVLEDGFALQVVDTGPGIPPPSRESIFQPFVRDERTRTTVSESTGLGLAISREMARAMGGDVTVESEEGVGSTFSLRLPKLKV
jgi:PAS domain S-box-containing protein